MTLAFVSKYGKWLNLGCALFIASVLLWALINKHNPYAIAWHGFLLGMNVIFTIISWFMPWWFKNVCMR